MLQWPYHLKNADNLRKEKRPEKKCGPLPFGNISVFSNENFGIKSIVFKQHNLNVHADPY